MILGVQKRLQDVLNCNQHNNQEHPNINPFNPFRSFFNHLHNNVFQSVHCNNGGGNMVYSFHNDGDNMVCNNHDGNHNHNMVFHNNHNTCSEIEPYFLPHPIHNLALVPHPRRLQIHVHLSHSFPRRHSS